MTAARGGRAAPALALALALAAGGCGKYGSPVRSAPSEGRDLGASEESTTQVPEPERPGEQRVEEGEKENRQQEWPERGESE